jgi:ATP-dependent DNA helicase PIF1
MLLRNLAPPKLCNGTRFVVKRLLPHLIELKVLTGCAAGETVLIPRIPLIPSDIPFRFKRLRFPLRVSFAITINKAQGQSFNTVGVDVSEECFSHGQLYVVCSRATNKNQLFIYSRQTVTTNVVYPEIL